MVPEGGWEGSAIRTRASIVRSRSPFIALSSVEFLLLSLNPISRKEANLLSKSSELFPIVEPKILDFLFAHAGKRSSCSSNGGDMGGGILSNLGTAELERSLNPNLRPGLGGNGGPSSDPKPEPPAMFAALARRISGLGGIRST